jgi:hypothetical protein
MVTKFGKINAARAINDRARLRLEARLAVLEASAGRAGVVQVAGGDLSPLHVLQERLAGLVAQIDLHKGEEFAETHALASALVEETLSKQEMPIPGSELHRQMEALQTVLKQAKKQTGELECIVCMGPLVPEQAFLFKNCYHLIHADCALRVARANADTMGDHTIIMHNPDPPHQPLVDEMGRTLYSPAKQGQFPSCGHMKCPECQDRFACDKDHFSLNKQAILEVMAGNVEAPAESAVDAQIAEARRKQQLFFIEVEGQPDKIMMLEAKIPYDRKRARDYEHGYLNGDFCGLFMLQPKMAEPPFLFDFDGSVTGGKAYYRAKVEPQQEGDLPACDPLPEGAVLTKTKPSGKKDDQGFHKNAGGAWKIELPHSMAKQRLRPPPEPDTDEEAEAAEKAAASPAGPSHAGKKRARVVAPEPDSDEESAASAAARSD